MTSIRPQNRQQIIKALHEEVVNVVVGHPVPVFVAAVVVAVPVLVAAVVVASQTFLFLFVVVVAAGVAAHAAVAPDHGCFIS